MFIYILSILAIITAVFFVYKKKEIQEGFSERDYEYKFDGNCDGDRMLMYEGDSENPGIPVEGTTENNKSLDGLIQACGKACKEKENPADNKSWEDFGVALGFSVYQKSEYEANKGRCYCEKENSSTCERKNIDSGYKRYDFISGTAADSAAAASGGSDDSASGAAASGAAASGAAASGAAASGVAASASGGSDDSASASNADSQQVKLENTWRTSKTYPTCTPAGTQPNTAKCPKNCVKPQDIGGDCIGADDPTDRRGYNDNPCERKDKSLFKKCNHKCLMPGMSGYEDLMPANMDDYKLEEHGCRNDAQCKECGRIDVDISSSSGFWKYIDKGAGIVKRIWHLHSLKFDDSNKATGYMQGYITKCEQERMQGIHKNSCPADLWSVEERQRKRAEAMAAAEGKEDEETTGAAMSHNADTSTGNMFLDINNPSHIGEKDMSLEDYYSRRILNNNNENRLGGSKTAYTRQYRPDKKRKVHYFNSVWKLF